VGTSTVPHRRPRVVDNRVVDDSGDQDPAGTGPSDGEPGWLGQLHERLGRLEGLVQPEISIVDRAQGALLPAWRRVTEGEPRWPVSLAVLAAIAMQLVLPDHLSVGPRYLLPVLEVLLLAGLIAANPRRINRQSHRLRVASMGLIALITLANATSAGRLIVGLVRGTEGESAGPLLIRGGAIWLTNVIVFALWYWELDRGGPVARAQDEREHPDFLFTEMGVPELCPPDWEPGFADYFYLSFTNAAAFSPTDTLPLTSWAKMCMLLQSTVSLSTVALVIARAVNILK
jgi:uncharacterized membrane protein